MAPLSTILLTTLIGLLLIIYFYVKFVVFTYWKRRGIWQFPNTTFPVGMAWPLLTRKLHMGEMLRNMYIQMRSENRKYAGFYLLTKPMLMITDPEDVKHVLATDFKHFKERGVWCNEEIDYLSVNLFALPAERWKRIRSKVSPFFSPNSMKTIFPTIEACGRTLIDVTEKYVETNESLNIKDLIWRYTTVVSGTCLFGYECNSMKNPNDDVKLVGKDIFDPSTWQGIKRSCFFLMPQILAFFRVKAETPRVNEFFMNLVNESIHYRVKNNINRADLMQQFINLRQKGLFDENGVEDGLTLNELAAQCWVFFAGGFDSAALVVTYCMYEVSKNQDIQDAMRKEILQELEKNNDKFSYYMVRNLKYTEKVIKEVLRKYSLLPFINRICTSDKYTFKDSNVTVRKGDAIVISAYGLQSDPECYPDPEKFNPERFNDENHIESYTYLPFGEGPRNCIAVKMGMMQGTYTVALLISKFKFYCNEKTKLPFKLATNSFTFSLADDIWLNVKRV